MYLGFGRMKLCSSTPDSDALERRGDKNSERVIQMSRH
jgi:hypothetical protein